MLWAIGSACVAFCATVFLDGANYVWSLERPTLYFGLAGVKSLLWLPVPVVTAVLLQGHVLGSYFLFVIWGTVGFLLQIVGFWLRMSHERTIAGAFSEWMLVSDRRYWELEHKSAGGWSGEIWQNLTSVLIYLWTLGLAGELWATGSATVAFQSLAVVLGLISVLCIVLCSLSMWQDLSGRNLTSWFRALHRGDAFNRLLQIVAMGIITGWFIICGTVY